MGSLGVAIFGMTPSSGRICQHGSSIGAVLLEKSQVFFVSKFLFMFRTGPCDNFAPPLAVGGTRTPDHGKVCERDIY